MKRLVLSAVALSMLALPISQANAGPRHEPSRYERHRKWLEEEARPRRQGRHYRQKWRQAESHRWARGHSVPDWQRKQAVRDSHRYGLRRPGYGQQWVKVDNDFLLVSIASGIIGGILAAQY